MSFYPLVIHKSVWDRLKRQTSPQEKPEKHNDEYIKGLIEKSQAWVKTWPDTVEGHMKKLKDEEKKKHQENIALIRANAKNNLKTYRADAVKKAKQMIFEDSCYGKQLISALAGSKMLEERELQIQFQKKKSLEMIEQEKSTMKPSSYCTFNLDENHETNKEQNKLRALECVNENRCIQLMKERDIKAQEIENIFNKEDTQQMNKILLNEIQLEEEAKKLHQISVKEYEIVQENIKEKRKKQNDYDDELIKIYQKEQERRKCKIQQILDKIHKDKQDTELHKQVYKVIEDSQAKQNKRYQFIDDRIQFLELENLKKDLDEKEKLKHARKKLEEISEYNRNIGKIAHEIFRCEKQCACDKQCLMAAGCKKDKRAKINISRADRLKDDITERKLNFLKPHNKLVDELRNREQQPSGWSGTKAAHEQFAKAANEIIQECKYKHAARKVVDDYRKLNLLDTTSLPVPNY